MIEIGSVMIAIAVIRSSPRNSRMTSEQRMAPEHPFLDQRLDRLPNINRLVHDQLEIDPRARHPLFEVLAARLPSLRDDLERAGAKLPVDRDVDLALAVDADDVGLDVVGVLGGGDVAQIDGAAVLVPQRNVPHVGDVLVHRIGVEHVVEIAELGVAAGQEDVGRVERIHDIQRRKPARLHLLAVEVGHDRADLAAIDHRRHGARNAP